MSPLQPLRLRLVYMLAFYDVSFICVVYDSNQISLQFRAFTSEMYKSKIYEIDQ